MVWLLSAMANGVIKVAKAAAATMYIRPQSVVPKRSARRASKSR
jgi:hypothetical protein